MKALEQLGRAWAIWVGLVLLLVEGQLLMIELHLSLVFLHFRSPFRMSCIRAGRV